jgi:hypothetical protein
MSIHRQPVRLISGALGVLSIMLLLALAACNLYPPTAVAPTTPIGDLIGTAAAQTIAAGQQLATIAALQAQLTSQAMTLQAPTLAPPTLPPSATALPDTPTSLPPTAAATWTPLPTYTPLPTFTSLPTATQYQVPMLAATVDTRCRQGPTTAWDVLGYLLVGQQAEILGINPEGTWWLIRDPVNRYQSCWVWGETTYPINDARMVPIVQPPPPPTLAPTASFSVSYSNFHICFGAAMAVFSVKNTGTMPFASAQISVRDLTNDVVISGPASRNDPYFGSSSACGAGFSPLDKGDGAYTMIGVAVSEMPPGGTKGRGVVTLCTKPNLGGQCVEQKVNFTFP